MAGRDVEMGYAQLASEESDTGITFLMALKGGGVKNCGLSEVFVSSEILYVSAAD